MHILVETIIVETMLAGLLYPNLHKLEQQVILLRVLASVPALITVACLIESYVRKNFKLIPLMLQMVMIRKELQLLFDLDHGENSGLAKNQQLAGVCIMVMMQVVIGSFTN